MRECIAGNIHTNVVRIEIRVAAVVSVYVPTHTAGSIQYDHQVVGLNCIITGNGGFEISADRRIISNIDGERTSTRQQTVTQRVGECFAVVVAIQRVCCNSVFVITCANAVNQIILGIHHQNAVIRRSGNHAGSIRIVGVAIKFNGRNHRCSAQTFIVI